MRRIEEYARVMGRPAAALRLLSGEHADVVLDDATGLAWRFPRHGAPVAPPAERITLARAHGLPAPEVIEVRPDCLVTRLLPGAPLTPDTPLDPDAPAALLRLLAAVPAAGGTAWRAQWHELEEEVRRRVAPLLSPEAARRALAEAEKARQTADTAPVGFVHGDLGGANVLVEDGRITGILDWDEAGPGDPAVDYAALSVSAPEPARRRLAVHFPDLDARAQVYAATFALQEAVHGLQHDDHEAVEAGLSSYR
ncbi:aminoglycoside phosphotransferase family protein [Nonomuraea typhae]|uniref:Aminoglycoside phosphotransferase family protein n=1 Tax=Nonomuraea typhae TaxID=2603600 RepID=A0ABW7YMG6_9ACTN